ncbi:recombinase family protein [Defluviimonas sp. SAOS-178_SWC]|uniref:recombinase family protein n=1 Tax=Defluviimonas sp. SAOS-178_SWC TaxID=3121287 RepID=UPI003221BA46
MADIKLKRRCAVYTRKSSEEGLEQEFNSLHAQREACEAYIASQRSEGWVLVRDQYDDGGISGGTLDRPGLQRLMTDIEDGLVDVVVVYKIDRLSRSLADFAKLVEVFDRNGVTFVSVTQSFNTTTSMGRLTLNILLSFAQFEREVTAERIRDKIAASRRKGIWMGGVPPYGYRVENRKLVIDDERAGHVRWIFAGFLEIGSATELAREVDRRGIRTPMGNRIDKKYLYRMLNNRAYIRAEESEVISAFDDVSLIQLIVERGADAVNALPQGIRQSKEAVAETIENNVRKLIIDETPINPKYYEKMSELLDALIEQRKREALSYQEYLAQIVELTKKAQGAETTASYPAELNSKAKRALFDNLDGDEALALAIDEEIRLTKKDSWRGNKFKEKEVRNAIKKHVADPGQLDVIFELVWNQDEY